MKHRSHKPTASPENIHSVYCLYDTINNVPYFGCTKDNPIHRFNCHMIKLLAWDHPNCNLQYAFDKDGDVFELRVLMTGLTKSAAMALEKQLIRCNPTAYNIRENPARDSRAT